MNNDESKDQKEELGSANSNDGAEKLKFGSLTPLTAAQIVTLLVGASSSSTSYGGY